uniref:Reverse transcriptase/retrotransposon-derived protein RNase H-like domain-containing protein n=1 Tax=Amphimedon queenslandica TaxID=400682 RepID=A0A1X7UWC3_AMPQE
GNGNLLFKTFTPTIKHFSPLYILLQKGKWAKEQETAVTKVKKQVVSPVLLVAFDPEKELLLQCDASPYGIGAVLAHNDLQDLECPIAYCSHSSLALAEKR